MVAPEPKQPSLSDTEGPDPETPLAEARLTIGTIGGAHGVTGEMRVRLSTDDPEHLLKVKRVYLGDETTTRKIESLRFHQGLGLFQLSGITTSDQVTEFTGQPLRISGRDARPLAANEFYLYQVIGITAVDEAGAEIGTVIDIMETGANDVFVISPTGGGTEVLFPSIPEVVIELIPAERRLVLRPQRIWDAEGDPVKTEDA